MFHFTNFSLSVTLGFMLSFLDFIFLLRLLCAILFVASILIFSSCFCAVAVIGIVVVLQHINHNELD